MSLSETRPKRSNAGNRMAKLLDAEDEDDFYKTTYGGFEEVSDFLNGESNPKHLVYPIMQNL